MKKKVLLVTILSGMLLMTGCASSNECSNHEWKDATCNEAKLCTVCGVTEGTALEHEWKDATCESAKTCTVCGVTEGTALEHEWKDATCDKAKTCTVCGIIEGDALAHDWKEATYEEPKTCSLCGLTDGDVLIAEAEEVKAVETAGETKEVKTETATPVVETQTPATTTDPLAGVELGVNPVTGAENQPLEWMGVDDPVPGDVYIENPNDTGIDPAVEYDPSIWHEPGTAAAEDPLVVDNHGHAPIIGYYTDGVHKYYASEEKTEHDRLRNQTFIDQGMTFVPLN